MKLVTKSVEAVIEPIPDDKTTNPHGEFEVVLATPGEDREGDDLEAKGWHLPLPEHITFDTDHGMSVKTLAGSGTPTLERDGRIKVKGTYAGTDHGQTTRQLVNERHIRTVSVTYLQRRTKAAGGKTSVVRELLNGSFVAVPANPRAVVLSSKSLVDVDQITYSRDTSLAQAIHDTACEHGADCDGDLDAKALTEVTIVTKGLAGSVEELGDRVRKAVRDQHRDERNYAYVRATFLDDPDKGTVVYELESYGAAGGGTTKMLARDFTLDGSKVTLDATPREVSLVTNVVEQDPGDVAAKSVGTADRALDLLVATGMTREDAAEMLGVKDLGATLASSEGAPAGTPAATVPADEAVTKSAAGTDAAASLDMRARALIQQIDDAAD